MPLKISLENAIEKWTWKMALQNAICKLPFENGTVK